MKKKIIIWGIVALIIAGSVYYFSRSKDDQSKYVTARAGKTDIVQTVSITGEITPDNKADLSFESGGVVGDIYVEVGDEVKIGDLIAKTEDSVARAQLAEALLEVERQEKILGQARRKWDDLSPEEKASAKLVVEKARAAAWTIQEQIKKSTLHSPIDGIIIKKYIEKGELAIMSSPIVTVLGEGGFEIKANVPESDIIKINLGQKAKVTFDAFSSDEIFEAEVSEIEPSATIIQDVVYYKVTFDILTKDERIKGGMSADMDIATAQRNGVLSVPGQGVKTENGKRYVDVLIGEGEQEEIRKAEVKVGLRGDDGMVEIISGLKEGENVVTFVSEK